MARRSDLRTDPGTGERASRQVAVRVGPADSGASSGTAPPATEAALAAWVSSGCPDPAPLRTGFNIVVRDGDDAVAAVGPRTGYSLYWTVRDGELLVAPGLPGLVAELGGKASLCSRSLALAGAGYGWHSPFSGVQRLTCGFRLVFRGGKATVHRWHRPEDADPIAAGREVHTMRSTLADAIAALQQRTFAVAMSGGLDSTTVAALAHRGGVHVDPWHAQADDRPGAEAVADAIGVPLHVVTNGELLFLDFTESFAERNFAPLQAPANAWYLRGIEQRSAEAGHTYLLNGRNGNAVYSKGPPVLGGWRKRLSLRRRGARRRDLPEHLRSIPLRLRWALHDATPAAHGSWTGHDIWWDDPFTDPEVRRVSFGMPDTVWDARGLARRVGEGLLPDQVRLRRSISLQSPDLPRILVSRRTDVAAAVDRVCASPSARRFVDPASLQRSIDLLNGDPADALVWRRQFLRPVNFGLFAAWWDERGTGTPESARSGG